MEYMVKSIRSRKRFLEKKREKHVLNLEELRPNEVIYQVQELVEAFIPQMSSRGLKIGIENLMKITDSRLDLDKSNRLSSDSSSRFSPNPHSTTYILADWEVYQQTLFHLIYSACK